MEWSKQWPTTDGLFKWRFEKESEYVEIVNGAISKGVPFSGVEWCRVGDVPQITEPIQYREPTIEDVGQMVEVRDKHIDEWKRGKLIYVRSRGLQFVIADEDECILAYGLARIIDTPRPKPREWWINFDVGMRFGFITDTEKAARQYNDMAERPVVHVREVTP